MPELYEGFGERPIEWIIEMNNRYSLFLEDPGSREAKPIKLIREGNSIKLSKLHEHITCNFLEEHLDTEFTEFAEVAGSDMSGNSRIQLRSSTAIAYISIF